MDTSVAFDQAAPKPKRWEDWRPVLLVGCADGMSSPTLFLCLLLGCLTVGQACKLGGRSFQNNEEWTERNSFIMRCTIRENGSWKTEVVACLSPTGSRIPLGEKITEGNDEWSCSVNGDGNVALSQGPSPNAKCGTRPVGSVWQEKSFELECRPGGVRELKACVTEDHQRIPVNSTRQVNGFTLVCHQYSNGTVVFHGNKAVNAPQNFGADHSFKCIDENSQKRNIGEFWVENHRFNKTCKADGAVEVVNCISKEGLTVPLNGQLIKDNTKYSCEVTNLGTIRYAAGPVDN